MSPPTPPAQIGFPTMGGYMSGTAAIKMGPGSNPQAICPSRGPFAWYRRAWGLGGLKTDASKNRLAQTKTKHNPYPTRWSSSWVFFFRGPKGTGSVGLWGGSTYSAHQRTLPPHPAGKHACASKFQSGPGDSDVQAIDEASLSLHWKPPDRRLTREGRVLTHTSGSGHAR